MELVNNVQRTSSIAQLNPSRRFYKTCKAFNNIVSSVCTQQGAECESILNYQYTILHNDNYKLIYSISYIESPALLQRGGVSSGPPPPAAGIAYVLGVENLV